MSLSEQQPVDTTIHAQQAALEGVTLTIGEIYEARLTADKSWVQALLLKFLDVDEFRFAVMKFCDSRSPATQNIIISPNTIRSFNKKRERKVKYDLYEQENELRELIGMKKLKTEKPKTVIQFHDTPTFQQKAHHVSVPRVLKAGMIPIEEVRLAEARCAQSLSEHTSYLKPFVSTKVYNRLIAGPEMPPLVPIVSTENLAEVANTTPVLVTDVSVAPTESALPSTATTTSTAVVPVIVVPTTSLSATPQLLDVPSSIKATLREYQVKGVSWLVDRYDRCINCILADEMGLGKTLQTICFFAYLKEVRHQGGPHLVVVPLSVMFNWITELKKFCPSLKVLRAHSNQAIECKILREKLSDVTQYDVVVTSYEMLKGSMESAFHLMVWRSVVLDEGHRIKNMITLLSKACIKLRARFKVILTGTPVQNNLSETYALLHFLLPTVFDTDCADTFARSFSLNSAQAQTKTVTTSGSVDASGGVSVGGSNNTSAAPAMSKVQIDRKALDAAHYLMRPFVLRRVKTEVEQTLPSKLETLVRCPLSDMQRHWIRALLMRESSAIMGLQGSGEGSGSAEKTEDVTNPTDKSFDWKRLQSLLAQLRKAANHPYLFTPAHQQREVTEEVVTASGKMVILDRLLRKLLAKGHRVVVFSQFTKTLDIIADFLDLRGYAHCRLDGSTHRVMREVLINQFNKPKSPYSIFCLSTRAGGEGVNLFTADTVVLFDSDWNPQVDIQAMARVHRIGQTKPVHIYRLVSQGTVEERIVQRAQKKLFLDCMVNRGSSAQGHEIDRRLQEARAARIAKVYSSSSGEEDHYWPGGEGGKGVQVVEKEGENKEVSDDDEVKAEVKVEAEVKTESAANPTYAEATSEVEEQLDASTVMSALKFGWNACFGAEGSGDAYTISDAALDAIIDRTRTCDAAVDALISAGTKNSSTRSAVKSESSGVLQEGQQSSVTQFEEAAPLVSLRSFEGETVHTSKAKPTLSDISAQWITASARSRQSRLETTHVVGVGSVSVLKANNYTLEEGESSIFDREAARHKTWASGGTKKGKRFEHQDYCQHCWNYGSLICCNFCPASYHLQCVGMKVIPTHIWSCPHHEGCVTCGKVGAGVGFLFRCEMCPNSYCEDCLPAEHEFVGVCERWVELGYNTPGSSCFIHCSASCADFAKVQDSTSTGVSPVVTVKKGSSSKKAVKKTK